MFQSASKMARCAAEDDSVLISRTTAFVSQLCEQLDTLYTDADLTDFTLIACGKEYKCHRVILAANSPMFKRMLKTPMREMSSNEMILDCISPQAVESILAYMYTGQARIPRESLKEVMLGADYFQMDELKRICDEKAPPVIQPSSIG